MPQWESPNVAFRRWSALKFLLPPSLPIYRAFLAYPGKHRQIRLIKIKFNKKIWDNQIISNTSADDGFDGDIRCIDFFGKLFDRLIRIFVSVRINVGTRCGAIGKQGRCNRKCWINYGGAREGKRKNENIKNHLRNISPNNRQNLSGVCVCVFNVEFNSIRSPGQIRLIVEDIQRNRNWKTQHAVNKYASVPLAANKNGICWAQFDRNIFQAIEQFG